MNPVRWLALFGLALAMLSMAFLPVAAQDATPEGTPLADCVAPELPLGTPSDPMASPVSEEAMTVGGEETAPAAEGPASRNIAQIGEDALANFVNCISAGNWEAVVALMTPQMWVFAGETTEPADLAAAIQDQNPQPLELIDVRNPVIDTNNRIGLDVVFSGFFNAPGVVTAERWFFIRDGDTVKLDEARVGSIPDDLFPEATVVTVQMVDYAFALDMNTVPAGPVVFRFSNTSYYGEPHVGATFMLTEGITAEQIITADESPPEDEVTAFVNAIFLEPGQSGDFYVENLEPGTYTIACDVTTPSGNPHWQLGMVAQFTVE